MDRQRYAAARTEVLALLPRGGTGAEIGTWRGDFAARILKTAAPCCLHLIDPWAPSDAPGHAAAWYGRPRGIDMDAIHAHVTQRFAPGIARGTVHLHRARSAEILPRLSGLDFVYIDGDHTGTAVRQDLEHALAATRPGGLICLDDHEIAKWWGDGVVRAANAFLGAHARDIRILFAAGAQLVLAKR